MLASLGSQKVRFVHLGKYIRTWKKKKKIEQRERERKRNREGVVWVSSLVYQGRGDKNVGLQKSMCALVVTKKKKQGQQSSFPLKHFFASLCDVLVLMLLRCWGICFSCIWSIWFIYLVRYLPSIWLYFVGYTLGCLRALRKPFVNLGDNGNFFPFCGGRH